MGTTVKEATKQGPQVSELEARQVAEAARETEWSKPSFVRELFLGKLNLDLIDPPPAPDPDEQKRAGEFFARVKEFLTTIDDEAIERTGQVPDSAIDALRRIGAFGIKIPREYGGLGLSQTSYNRTIALISTKCGAIGVLLSAHQSIGVPQPLKMFGTEAQKQKYLPRLAAGAISAFALTEPDVRSHGRWCRLHPQRRKAVVHERPDRRADGRHGAHAREARQQAQRHHGIHRGIRLAGRIDGASLRIHGFEGHLQWRDPLHQRARPA